MNSTLTARLALGLGLLAILAATGCREEEQGRVLIQQKGVYQGTPDQTLSEDQIQELRFRARQQQI
ncbi:MAG: hypothetical protein HKM95_10325 [Inquilinus sp.]|nr:hypothetical protein [Inquilinus sp.]